MDRILIEEKLESLRHCVKRIETKRPEDPAVLRSDWDVQDIIALNLTRAVQRCVDIAAHVIAESEQPPPDTMAESFVRLQNMGVIDEEPVLIHASGLRAAPTGWGRRSCPWCKSSPILARSATTNRDRGPIFAASLLALAVCFKINRTYAVDSKANVNTAPLHSQGTPSADTFF